MSGLGRCFECIEDPRSYNTVHRFGDLLVIMIAASLCGAANATEFALFAETRKTIMARLVSYERAPSHDTFSRLLRRLDPAVFAKAFGGFARQFSKALAAAGFSPSAKVVALDGKALRRAYERGLAASPPLMVSAFAAEARLCLATAEAGEENEVEAALKVVELLDLTGAIVTADALHCHHRMAEAVTAKRGDYVLALKANRHHWHRTAEAAFASDATRQAAATRDIAHGRHEWRRAEVLAATPLCTGHKAFIRITARRDDGESTVRLYMASRLFTAKEALAITRCHWQIENALHWLLDVHLDEDSARVRKDHAPANIANLKRLARNILQTADNPKVPFSHRIKKCAWDDDYLLNAITHMR